MTNKISNGRGKKIVSGKVASVKKGRAVAVKKAGEKTNALKKVARSKRV